MDAVAFYANIATLIAVFIAAWQVRLGRKAASAGAFMTLNESLRQAWLHFSAVSEQGSEQQRLHAFSDVMNLLESACAIFEDKIFVGKVGTLLEDYLCHVLILIQQSEDARSRIERIMVTEKTFDHILRFVAQHRSRISGIQLPGLV